MGEVGIGLSVTVAYQVPVDIVSQSQTYTVQCTGYCTEYTVYCIQCTVYCILYSVQCTVYCTVYCVYCTLYTVQCTVCCTVYCILYTVQCICRSARQLSFAALLLSELFELAAASQADLRLSAVNEQFQSFVKTDLYTISNFCSEKSIRRCKKVLQKKML